MALGSVHVGGTCSKAQLAEIQKLIDNAVDAHNSAENSHGDLRARINAIELRLATNVTKNPFNATFNSLDGLIVSGVWNADLARIEF